MTNVKDYIQSLPQYNKEEVDKHFQERFDSFRHKVIALDDDPTGVQTVHNIPVFTDWSEDTIEQAFDDPRQLVFILTNSRSFSEAETKQVHQDIAERIARISQKKDMPFLLISRGDSTLRGHYPLETEVLKDTLEQNLDEAIDGEIIMPFFRQGGRLTVQDVHYIQQGDTFTPVGESEFAKDRMFGFQSSSLPAYIEEKTNGSFPKEQVECVTLEELRNLDIDAIEEKLLGLTNFQKLVVNAIEDEDIRVFCIALYGALAKGKNFLYRTAATFTKEVADISAKPYLKADTLYQKSTEHGGLIVVGSHVQKSTDQLHVLQENKHIHFIEFNCLTAQDKEAFQQEKERVQQELDQHIADGTTVCVYTSRERLDLGDDRREEELKLSVDISKAVTEFVKKSKYEPKFVIAKGGITSSDVGTNGLGVTKAEVLGQIAPGIPVWKTGEDSRFTGIPYIIFPGNVGSEDTLKEVVEILDN
ncbi:Uncharacterized conserved protein YgbK, DUF1537 family [Alteribacillus persepolensis]|uniref:Uncharacterized conserved protein YgbK, DUF1537 family n=1 Tax=Alteribacillus persepolensis TaxID=568899 RepID=A0A1G8FSX0_9BACI|nr:four-carbon acid sugar kinase family protein [Alteribacillus persepolensis]SDH85214.1 Uncharacterized conserved protein YgbK, DUF1537 family [Alteribacillus persepolensis]